MAKILLVDDEPDIIAIYKTKLEEAGFEVSTARDGVEAVAAAAASRPDLILMDMKMPNMDGVAAQQKLKNDPATKDLRVVFLTAFADPMKPEVDKAFARQSGAVDFIQKGIDLDELVQKVKGYLLTP